MLTGDRSQQIATFVDKGRSKSSWLRLERDVLITKQVFNGHASRHSGQRHGLLKPKTEPQHRPWLRSEGGRWGSDFPKQVKTGQHKEEEKTCLPFFRTLEAFRAVHPKTIRKLYKLYRLDFELFGFSAKEYLSLAKTDSPSVRRSPNKGHILNR